jgi:membrane protease YdiL (CAAX protease family)
VTQTRTLAAGTASSTGSLDGLRFLRAVGGAIVAAALTGTAAWFVLRSVISPEQSAVAAQIVVAVVYGTLIASFVYAFRPLNDFPLDLKFTSANHLGLAVLAWFGVISTAAAVYLLLSPVTGGLVESARQILSIATDVKRLDGQPTPAWALAITRGCLIVPVFEEVFFRGLVLGWLRKHLADRSAIAVSAALFAVMHGYPIVFPYAFVFGLFTGWVRLRTGSTLNTIVVHVLNNVVFLFAGLSLLK